MAIARRDIHTWGTQVEQRYLVQHLERFPLGTTYPLLVSLVQARLDALPLPGAWHRTARLAARLTDGPPVPRRGYTLVLDNTGVGEAVGDLFEAAGLAPVRVTLTGGQRTTEPERDRWRVPKITLIDALQVAIQTRRFLVAKALPDAAVLVKEAQNFQYKISGSGTGEYTLWRESQHDDLVFAAALVAWWGEHTRPVQRSLESPTHAKGMGNPFEIQKGR